MTDHSIWGATVALTVLLAGCGGEPGADDAAPGDGQAPTPEMRAAPPAVVRGPGVGCLEIGMSRAAVETACGEVSDTTLQLEGSAQPAAWVEVGGGSALAELVDGAVWRIRVLDPALRTSDSVGVGMPVSSLVDLPGIAIIRGEGTFARTDDHCGMTFRLEGLPSHPGAWTNEQLTALPDSARVSEILVFGGCG